MRTRYIADWIIDMDDDGTAEDRAVLSSFEAAKAHAIREGKRAGAIEWWAVREQEFIGCNDGGPPYWQTVRRWHGDWDGNYDETGD